MPVVHQRAACSTLVGQSLLEEQWQSERRRGAHAQHGIPMAGGAAGARGRTRNRELRGHGHVARNRDRPRVDRLEDPLDLRHLDYVPSPELQDEERDLLRAIQDARRAVDDTREELGEKFGPDFAAVFNTHVQILEDKGFLAKLKEAVVDNVG